MMAIDVDLQVAGDWEGLPAETEFLGWARAVLGSRESAELSIRIVGREESRSLNDNYRDKDSATNVLSFPAGLPEELEIPLLGDVVICAPVVLEEASEQKKQPIHHWAHMTVHGILHLLGYDHVDDVQAEEMERLETEILASLGMPDPYH